MTLSRPLGALTLLAAIAAAPLPAQLPPLTVPRGLLRLDFGGRFDNWDQRYLGGVKQDAASDFIRETVDGRWLAPLGSAEDALRRVTGVQALSLSLGRTSSSMLVNVGTANLGAAYGLTRRLTIFGNVPIVRIRVQEVFKLDSTNATAGFNPADPLFGDAAGQAKSALFFGQLSTALATLQTRLQTPYYDTIPGAKAVALATLARGTALQTNLRQLYDAQNFLPLTGTPGAGALNGSIDSLRTRLKDSLLIEGFSAPPALPSTRIGNAGFEDYTTAATGPIAALPFAPPILSYLGDIEVGAAFGWLDHRPAQGGLSIRSTLQGLVRLRTGKLDRPNSFFDLSTGDRQPDVQGDLVTDVMHGRLGARITGRYVLQLPGRLDRRLSPPDQPIAPANTQAAVERDPGEIVEASVEPFVRIAPTLALSVGVRYWSKGLDRYKYLPNQTPIAGTDPSVLAIGSKQNATVLSAGVSFADPGARVGSRSSLPMDAFLRWEMVTGSSQGQVPARQSVSFGLRLYRRFP